MCIRDRVTVNNSDYYNNIPAGRDLNNLPNNSNTGTTAVSYTHLDVYKRQYEYYLTQAKKYDQTIQILHDVNKHIKAIEGLYGAEQELSLIHI